MNPHNDIGLHVARDIRVKIAKDQAKIDNWRKVKLLAYAGIAVAIIVALSAH